MWRSRPLRWGLIGLGALLVTATVVLFLLDRQITERFESRRRSAPAHVYARPLELYEGALLGPEALEQHLRELGYRRVLDVGEVGTYSRFEDDLELISRPFRFWDGEQPAQHAYIQIAGDRIARLTGDDARTPLPILRLDPLRLGRIFPGSAEDRILIRRDEIPAILTAALIQIEDGNFPRHHGLDLRGIMRALLVNLEAGEVRQGGSTLTQQLVKSLMDDRRRTLLRKLREAIMAVQLESHYTKDEILTAYVNEVYLGQDGERTIRGFALASRFYFGRPLDELGLHQLALLVGMVRGPSLYDPHRHPERARARRDQVLYLLAQGVVEVADAIAARDRPLDLTGTPVRGATRYPAFMALVRDQLQRHYDREILSHEGLQIFTTLDPMLQRQAEQLLDRRLKQLERRVRPGLEGALVVCSVADAELLAVVGGRRAQFDGFNRALDASRNVGSLIKPVVYLTALESGRYTLATAVIDSPLSVELSGGRTWEPANFDGEYYGRMSLMRALADSRNLAAVRVGLDLGVPAVVRQLQELGLGRDVPPYESVLLGGVSMSPFEVAQIYNTLANGGFRAPLSALQAVLTAAGQPLTRYPLRLERAADPAAVHQLNAALILAMRRGTGRSARDRLPEWLEVAGKTGTTNELRDSWFAGFSGDHLAVVWIGRDDNSPARLSGGRGALQLWADLFANLGTNSYAAPLPEGLVQVWLDYPSGLLTTAACGEPVAVPVPVNAAIAWLPGCEPDR